MLLTSCKNQNQSISEIKPESYSHCIPLENKQLNNSSPKSQEWISKIPAKPIDIKLKPIDQLPYRAFTVIGQLKNLNDYFGTENTLILFWAPWCESSLEEIKKLNDISKNYNTNELKIILVSIDQSKDGFQDANELDIKFNNKYGVFIIDDGIDSRLCNDLNIIQIPHFILLNSKLEVINSSNTLLNNMVLTEKLSVIQ